MSHREGWKYVSFPKKKPCLCMCDRVLGDAGQGKDAVGFYIMVNGVVRITINQKEGIECSC
jgi:hypothetical protein